MKLEHTFTVPADLDTVWAAVLDPERVAPCMPGASLSEVDGDSFKGTVKVKVGPISLQYKGSGEFLEKDEAARKVVIKAAGKDTRGNGTASATVTVTLRAEGAGTTGSVDTDLSITGKPAQFGRGLIAEVGGRILDSFATCLATKLGPPRAGGAEPPRLTSALRAEGRRWPPPKLSVVERADAVATGAAAGGRSPESRRPQADEAEADRRRAPAGVRADRPAGLCGPVGAQAGGPVGAAVVVLVAVFRLLRRRG